MSFSSTFYSSTTFRGTGFTNAGASSFLKIGCINPNGDGYVDLALPPNSLIFNIDLIAVAAYF
jgi:hypothetical protein